MENSLRHRMNLKFSSTSDTPCILEVYVLISDFSSCSSEKICTDRYYMHRAFLQYECEDVYSDCFSEKSEKGSADRGRVSLQYGSGYGSLDSPLLQRCKNNEGKQMVSLQTSWVVGLYEGHYHQRRRR